MLWRRKSPGIPLNLNFSQSQWLDSLQTLTSEPSFCINFFINEPYPISFVEGRGMDIYGAIDIWNWTNRSRRSSASLASNHWQDHNRLFKGGGKASCRTSTRLHWLQCRSWGCWGRDPVSGSRYHTRRPASHALVLSQYINLDTKPENEHIISKTSMTGWRLGRWRKIITFL